MAKPVTSGRLTQGRIHFQSREIADDGFGNITAGDFVTRFTKSATYAPLRGGETVIAARLAGTQPYVITVRSDNETRSMTTAWRAVDARDPRRLFNITAITDPTGKRQWIDLLVTEGTPDGE